ncbi:ATP-binding cassette domain-containing protein [Halapricum sp. CBA1109]|uniref:ABC transporter ATP-binding protein n=1 Tax=Halapricum sp. CBA1109 TaxID=2668068 RepID=UPI0012FC813B|nr:ABC transporter ATP-binding protein [Halapricum sp. CBA1109]MUV90164.1 ATP-binding cassette domain-containing protein [Halapricum sp. CBA1109]
MAAIQLDGLTKTYGGGVTALQNVDLTVEEGEIFGFLGPNGAGKSTTINILLDFVRPTSGSARVLGMDAQEDSLEVRRRTGVLPEGYQVYDRLTGKQHVQFVIESKESDEQPADVLERVGLTDAAERKAGGYSKGMQQRLTLAMALVGDPDLLILDEPSTGLDPAGVRGVRETVKNVAEQGTTIFFSSHILPQVEAVCDRVSILRKGEVVAVDTMEGLRESVGADGSMTVYAEPLTDEHVAAAERVQGVTSVTHEGDSLTLSVADYAKYDALNAIAAQGATITDFSTTEASLEELFMSYTEGSR